MWRIKKVEAAKRERRKHAETNKQTNKHTNELVRE
jgi:hypothetical protein